MTTFDEIVEGKVQPQHRDIVDALRVLMKELAPAAVETVSHGGAVWKQGGQILAILSPSKTHITLAFSRGAEFTDAHGLLQGEGKTTRHVKVKNLGALDRPAIADYVAQGLKLAGA